MLCPNCNNASESTTSKFCTSCGFELTTPTVEQTPKHFEFIDNTAANKRKNRIGYVVGIVGFCIIVPCYIFFIKNIYLKNVEKLLNRKNNIQMEQTAANINKSCPLMVDDYTRLDNAMLLSNNEFQYNYTLVQTLKDSINIEEIKNNLSPKIINSVRTNLDMKFFRDAKETVSYSYVDKNGEFVMKIKVTPDMYQ